MTPETTPGAMPDAVPDTVLGTVFDAFAGFAKEGGRVGSGSLGCGTGGVARCVR
ncbi:MULTISPECIES: hypothetical protein [unclassified Streptomyces]|uniref:hypothetical protein n=1 Tax=unclassified Streptomyces TaxID=2593676 RepID=UPI00136F65E7|nr:MULTISPECIES: hypothetical protein [unclassified Streptomyces]MYS18760.1 hypothetical protein [Streptomyces sp. SID4948]